MSDRSRVSDRTVADFGEQWTRYRDNEGWYGSLALFRDVFGPLLPADAVAGRRVAEIGSGTGRIVRMLLEAGAAHVTALEPSEAFAVLEANTAAYGGRVTRLRLPGDALPAGGGFDQVFAIGVLHHIPDPAPVVAAAYRALRPGGVFAAWLYGREGNTAYLTLAAPLRALTTRLPHAVLAPVSAGLTAALSLYVAACRAVPLPLHRYMRHVIANLSLRKRYLVVYDQLNPAYSRYYTEAEARSLFAAAGFVDVALYHRHGYSWTVVGRKPGGPG